MAKETGIAHYVCDRDKSHEAYIKEGSSAANAWHTVYRYTQDGAVQEWLYCDECYREYKELAGKQDAGFVAFMQSSKEV